MSKKKVKINKFALALLLALPAGLYIGQGLLNKYWLPGSLRQFLLPPKFSPGQCIKANWAINPKIVVGHKVKNEQIIYLLKDDDKYEHLQYIPREAVEKNAARIPCGDKG